MPNRVLGGLLAVLLFAWGFPLFALADEGIAWTVAAGDDGTGRPNFVYTAEPGQAVEDTWVVGNAGTEPVTLQVYAADAFTTASGQLDLQPADVPATGLGSWVQLSTATLTLAPAEQSEVSFTVMVPADALPGDYAGGLVTSLFEDSQGQVQIERRLATRIHVRVPGELTTSFSAGDLTASASAAVNPFSTVSLEASYRALNDGTARAFGREVITVEGPFGLGRTTVNREVPEVLPGSALEQSLTLDGVWALGPTTVSVELIAEGIDGTPGQPVTAMTTLWIVPWGWIGIVVLVLGVAVVLGVVRARRRWEWVAEDEAMEPQEPATM